MGATARSSAADRPILGVTEIAKALRPTVPMRVRLRLAIVPVRSAAKRGAAVGPGPIYAPRPQRLQTTYVDQMPAYASSPDRIARGVARADAGSPTMR
jgi:hypothetical protein